METPKHQKIIKTTVEDDGTIIEVSESYYEKLAHRVEEREKQFMTSRESILKDIVTILGEIQKGSPRITIVVDAKYNQPYRITKRWVVQKDNFDRR